ncbi:hypothetical protein TNCV_1531341 [Trichonephila clavipes]|nr:hypothetical protein TNCV_1531341 [Trichonephila clavipes]
MCRNGWERLSDKSSKETSPIDAKRENICGYIRGVRGSEKREKKTRLGVLEGAELKPPGSDTGFLERAVVKLLPRRD